MATNQYHTVHYRKLVRTGNCLVASLSDAIQTALNTIRNGRVLAKSWPDRVTNAAGDEKHKRFFNHCHMAGEYAFGNLCAFTGREMQAVVETMAQTGATAALKDLTAPGGTDYLHGIAYWLVVGDHCYVVQHARVRTKALEEYLTWLLRDLTQTAHGPVTLQAEFDVAHVGGDLGDVNAIELGGLAPETVADGPDAVLPVEVVDRRRSLAERMAPFTRAFDVLKAALGSVEAERLIRRVPDDAALQVMLNISYLAKSRKVDKTAMRDLSVALRNLDDGEVRVRAKDGTIRSDEARLHAMMPFRRVRENGNLLDLEDVREKLLETHRRFRDDGKIAV